MLITGHSNALVNPPLPEPLRPLPPFGEIDLTPLPPVRESLARIDRVIESASRPATFAARQATAVREAAHPDYAKAVAELAPALTYTEAVEFVDRVIVTGNQD